MAAGPTRFASSHESRATIGAHMERFFAGIALVLLGAAVVVAGASLVLHEDLGGTLTVLYLLFASVLAVFLGGFSYFVLGPKLDR